MAEEIKRSWYKEMAVYQIWPRSFCDGNGDGIGDLKGVLSKLDYIKSLGVDAIWFSPLYKSPQADFGYDIADYRDIAPEYGTLDDFKEVLKGAHDRGLRVIMDLVVNHTSDQHQWFLESKKGKDNPYHDYYYWRPGKGKHRKPNNWKSTFGGDGWEYDEGLDEYYLHLFAKEQPDLNMDNPKVREEVKDIMRFWLDMGVDGFREDVITFISKDEGLPSSPYWFPIGTGIEHYMHGPHLDEYLMEFKNDVLSKYDCMTVGEAPMMTPEKALMHIKEGDKQQLNMMFHFQHMEADCFLVSWVRMPFNLKKLKKVYTNWQQKLYGKAWNALYIENHDQPRIVSRYGDDGEFRVQSAKMLAVMYMCQSGTPFVFQGQEIGMTDNFLDDINDYVDVSTINVYNIASKIFGKKIAMNMAHYASRDNARTPVQWSDDKNAGFTSAEKPWFFVNPNYEKINVASQEDDPDSILNFYRQLIRFRKEHDVCIYGSYKEYYHGSKNTFVYSRHLDDKKMLVVCSFSKDAAAFKAPDGFDLSEAELVLQNYRTSGSFNNAFTLRPYETRVYYWDK